MIKSQKHPYKQTPETIKIILDAIGDGLTQRDASKLAGISEDTLCLWKKGNSDLSEQMRQKEIEFKRSLIQIIKKEALKNWRASAWLLERKYKKEYSLNPKHEQEIVGDFPALEFNMERVVSEVIDKL